MSSRSGQEEEEQAVEQNTVHASMTIVACASALAPYVAAGHADKQAAEQGIASGNNARAELQFTCGLIGIMWNLIKRVVTRE